MTWYCCAGCGETKDAGLFPPDNRKATGIRVLCRVCYAEQRRLATLRLRERVREEVRAEAQARAQEQARARENVVPPRTFVTTEVWTPVDRGYYRNDGNKSVPSLGVWA